MTALPRTLKQAASHCLESTQRVFCADMEVGAGVTSQCHTTVVCVALATPSRWKPPSPLQGARQQWKRGRQPAVQPGSADTQVQAQRAWLSQPDLVYGLEFELFQVLQNDSFCSFNHLKMKTNKKEF